MSHAAIIVAAGQGTRLGGPVPKQFQQLAGQSVLARSVRAFVEHPHIDDVVVVVAEGRTKEAHQALGQLANRVILTLGDDSRDGSVRAGLRALPDRCDAVLIHDGARPLVSKSVIDGVIDALRSAPAAAPALPVSDALWYGQAGKVQHVQDRSGLYRAQTPQGFHLSAIRAAHDAHPGGAADDVAVALAAGLDVAITQGEEDNLKLTHPGDFARAARILEGRLDIRTGLGFDVHAFAPGDHVVLCGVRVPHARRLQGHSDADVGMHALTDAIYGALAQGDIGRHFPPSDPQWKGADSRIFLAHAADLARDMGFTLTNADVTLICERPKIGPHADAMQQALAQIMQIAPDRVSVKATTSERLGFTGREEGIAAQAVATLVKE